MTHVLRYALVMVVLALPTAALADPSSSDRQAARAHYKIGNQHYERGEYDLAIAEFEIAHKLSGAPGLLYNIAQAHRLRGNCAEAKAHYERFLAEGKDAAAKTRNNASAFLRELGDCGAGEADRDPVVSADLTVEDPASGAGGADAIPDDTRPRDEGGGSVWPVAGLIIAGAGISALGIGAYYVIRTGPLSDDVSAACNEGRCNIEEGGVEALPEWEAYQSARTRAVVFSVVGGAAIVGGGLIYFLSGDDDAPQDRAFTAYPTRGGGMVSWSGTF